ncbi:hypothetical protein Tco_1447097 [Tanacetum coccineum]
MSNSLTLSFQSCRIIKVSAVTYTSDYPNSEPGRVFWGTDEEVSEGGIPRVIVYGYDGFPIQPVPWTRRSVSLDSIEDPEEDPEYEDDEEQDGPVDYPMGEGDDGGDDESRFHLGEDADDEDNGEDD